MIRLAYEDLRLLARDHRRPRILRALAVAACVLLHRVLLLLETGADREVDAAGYLRNAIDTATRTSRALLDEGQGVRQ